MMSPRFITYCVFRYEIIDKKIKGAFYTQSLFIYIIVILLLSELKEQICYLICDRTQITHLFAHLLFSVLRFTSSFMTAIRRRRTKAVVLYATETARSQTFARQLAEMLDYAFDSRAMCMEDYDAADLKNEALVYFVASTFGDGDPPENGRVSFAVTLKIWQHSGGRLNKKDGLTRYGDSHVKDKTS